MANVSTSPSKKDAAVKGPEYAHQCAALGIKPNSRVARNEAVLTEQTRVDFSLNLIGGGGLRAITDALAGNPNLEALLLPGNGLTNESVVFLCRALRGHARLRLLDLSDNALSLPAGLGLIELVRSNPALREVRLNGTLMEDAVQNKIKRLLNLAGRGRRDGGGPSSHQTNATNHTNNHGGGAMTPYRRAVAEHEEKANRRRQLAAQRKTTLEESATAGIAEALAAAGSAKRGPLRGPDGWAVLQLYISTTPFGFASELRRIHQVIIPKLNRTFASRKVCIVPFSMYHEVRPLSKAQSKEAPPRTPVVTDHQQGILKAAPLFLQLVGDRVGLTEFVPGGATAQATLTPQGGLQQLQQQQQESAGKAAAAAGLAGKTAKLNTVPYVCPDGMRMLERELLLAQEVTLPLVFRRCSALSMGVPPALASTVSDDPHVVYPDPAFHTVKLAVAKAQGSEYLPHSDFDFDLQQYLWRQHVDYKVSLDNRVPRPCLVDYAARFETVDSLGQVVLSQLEAFEQALTRRLAAVVEHLYPLPEGVSATDPAPTISAKLTASPVLGSMLYKAVMQQALAHLAGRKGVAGKLDLYTVTPPSRNMALVTCTPGCGGSSIACSYVARCSQKANYHVVSHFARNPWMSSQPSDLRSVLLGLASQLMKGQELPTHIRTEVDMQRIKAFFNTTLANTSGDAGDANTVIVVVDGIDDIDPVVLPCRSLRVSDTGADEWDPPAELRSVQKPLPSVTHRPIDTFEWIPICLSRNLRVVATVQSGSSAHRTLELRGHDSCDALPMGDIGENDVDSILMREAEAFGVTLRDEDLSSIRTKLDARVPEYLQLVLDQLRRREERQQYTTRLTALTQLPETTAGMCELLLSSLEAELGAAVARTLVCLLLVSRWGLLEYELRILLRQQRKLVRDAGGKAAAPTDVAEDPPLANGEVFQKALRLLRPVLYQTTETLANSHSPCNGLHLIVHIRSRTFRTVAQKKYLPNVAADWLPFHGQLAHLYRRLMANNAAGPLEAKAVMEFPYHVLKGQAWGLLESNVASLQFVSQTYLLGLGYESMRELVRSYNTLDDIETVRAMEAKGLPVSAATADVVAPMDCPSVSRAQLSDETVASLKLKLREYIYFMRNHNVNLVQYPHMVRQIAITCPQESCLFKDAQQYFRSLEQFPHFVVMNRGRNKLHHQAVTDCVVAPTGLRIASCSDDRNVKISSLTADALITISHSVSKVTRVCYSATSRYLAAACEDRTLMVADATNGTLVSRPPGHTTALSSLALSARGRYLFSGGEDRILKAWDSESGVELFKVSHVHQSHHTSPYGGVNQILTHPQKEDEFYTVCDKKLLGWRIKSSALDDAIETLCIVAHGSLPLATAHLACDGTFAVTTARDLPISAAMAAASTTPAVRHEDNIKLWSIATGRCLATLPLGTAGSTMATPGHVSSALSPSERFLAAACSDGGLDLYRIDWRSLAPVDEPTTGTSAPVILTPCRRLSAFREHPSPELLVMRFSFDSRYVAAIGNRRQLKVWETDIDLSSSTTTAAAAAADTADTDAKPSGGGVVRPVGSAAGGSLLTALSAADYTVAEFLMDQPATTMDWTANPAGDDTGELFVGDAVGKVYALRLKR